MAALEATGDTTRANDLTDLARDLRWAGTPAADALWRQLAPDAWEQTQSASAVLQTLPRHAIDAALADPTFRQRLDALLDARRRQSQAVTWFQTRHADAPLSCVAYFSMEYMLSEALPIYSGGLGNVAGDQLKAAGDLGVPLVAVGLLYQQGYFRQMLDRDGWQQTLFPFNDPSQLPVRPVQGPDGAWLRLEVKLPGYSIWLRAWQVHVGRCRLYLLDSNDPANPPMHRGITSSLYGGWHDLRLRQELVLGIGGWRLLRALGLRPEVCHLNEGHAAFAVLERAREFMEETGQPFDVALAATRVGNLFTTHTAVPAGFDRFEPGMITQFLGRYAGRLKLSMHELLALGRANPDDPSEPFNMAYLAIRGSGAINGVSRLHGEVSRRLFEPLFPRVPQREVPVGHVTNGVHVPTWTGAAAEALWNKTASPDRWNGLASDAPAAVQAMTDADLWELRCAGRRAVVAYACDRLAKQFALAGESPEAIEQAAHLFDPNALTLGFARRFAAYKRPDLLLSDPDRLLRLLTDPLRPVQLILAGKAHPGDEGGRARLHRWVEFVRNTDARRHVMVLSDYDMRLAMHLVRGVDVWLNNPRRPWEASGTSGMKVLANGGVNLSELDGWWAEAYEPDLGWAIGDGQEHADEAAGDARDAAQLFDQLEQHVVPAFYARSADGVPAGWVAKMRQSMARLTPRFSADRTVREYTETYYLPAVAAARARAANAGAPAADLVRWKKHIDLHWPGVRFGPVQWTTVNGEHRVTAELELGAIGSESVRVQVYADPAGGHPGACVNAELQSGPGRRYHASVVANRPVSDFTLRAVPFHSSAVLPLELPSVCWQR